jgi:hypothetical protein
MQIAEALGEDEILSELRGENTVHPFGKDFSVAPAARLRSAVQRREEVARELGPSGPSLSAGEMHPAVWGAGAHLWSGGHRRAALQQASSAIFDAMLPAKLGVAKGASAAEPSSAFSTSDPTSDSPRLRFARVRVEDEKDWRNAHDGARFIGMGCQAYIRNLTTHDTSELAAPIALEQARRFELVRTPRG